MTCHIECGLDPEHDGVCCAVVELPPKCDHWIFGNISVNERDGPLMYERAALFTFKTAEDFRAAMRFFDPVYSSGSNHLEK